LRASLKMGPSTSEVAIVQYRLASVLQKRGQLDESAGVLQGLLDQGARADMPPALLEWLARHWLDQKAFDKAARAAETLAKNAPNADWKQIGWCLAGKALVVVGKNAEARKAFEEALKQPAKTGEGAEAALYLADIDRRAQQWDSAEKFYQQAADISGELLDIRAKSYYGLGLVAEARRQWEVAARYYMSVAVLFDDPAIVPECLFRAAESFRQLGREEDRKKTLEELKSRYPDSEWSRDESGMEHQVAK
jgi:tetratricopeptide (TPR) repeat protein